MSITSRYPTEKNFLQIAHDYWKDLGSIQPEKKEAETNNHMKIIDDLISECARIDTTVETDRTFDDWRLLATQRAITGAAYAKQKNYKEAINHYLDAIAAIDKIPQQNRMVAKWEIFYVWDKHASANLSYAASNEFIHTDWQVLVLCQCRIVEAYDHLKEGPKALEHTHKALFTSKKILEDMRTPHDWRCLASIQAHLSHCYYEPTHKEGLQPMLDAIISFNRVPEEKRTERDWHELAIYQNRAGCIYHKLEMKLLAIEYLKAAIVSIKKIPEDMRILDNWRTLAHIQENLGCCHESDPSKDVQYLLEAITSLNHVPEEKRTYDDRSDLARFQLTVASRYNRLEMKLPTIEHLETAIVSMKNIPEDKRTPDNWRKLATFQESLGTFYPSDPN